VIRSALLLLLLQHYIVQHACLCGSALWKDTTQHNTTHVKSYWNVVLGTACVCCEKMAKMQEYVLGPQITGFAMLVYSLAHGLPMNHGGIQSVTARSSIFSLPPSPFLGLLDMMKWLESESYSVIRQYSGWIKGIWILVPWLSIAPVGRETSVVVCASFQCTTSISKKKKGGGGYNAKSILNQTS